MSDISKAGQLVRAILDKEAGIGKSIRRGVGAIPRIIQKGFSTMGEQASKELGGQGPLAFAAKWGLKAAPTVGVGYAAHQLVGKPVVYPYMQSKHRQFEAGQERSTPYYNYGTGSYE
jgi:hypothetical protein